MLKRWRSDFCSASIEQDAEGVVVDQRADAGGDFAEQFVEIEDGGEFVRDPRAGADGAVLAFGAAVELGVVDGGGDAGSR